MDRLAEKTFAYGTIEKALMSTFGIKEGSETIARALLKNLRALGLPGDGPGRGVAHAYRQGEIDGLAVALHLEMQIGLPPAGAVQFIKGNKDRLASFARRARAAEHGDVCIIIGRKHLPPRWVAGGHAAAEIVGSFHLNPRTPERMTVLWDFLTRGASGLVVNLTDLFRKLDAAIEAACLVSLSGRAVLRPCRE